MSAVNAVAERDPQPEGEVADTGARETPAKPTARGKRRERRVDDAATRTSDAVAAATARLAASGLRSCNRCLAMSPPQSEGCILCGRRFSAVAQRALLTVLLRATVIPMFVGAVGACAWLLMKGQSPAMFVGLH